MDMTRLEAPNQLTFRRRLGNRILSRRREHGWSRRELAARLNVPANRLGKWEAGRAAPPLEDVVALSRALGVSSDELLTGTPLPLPPDGLSAEARAQVAAYLAALLEVLG